MGSLSFLGYIREGSSGQLIITVPKKFRKLVTPNKLLFIFISDKKADITKGEKISYETF
jgi:hypothetical protein